MYPRLPAAFVALPLLGAAVLAVGCAVWAMSQPTRVTMPFAWLMGGISWWLCTYALELNSASLADAVIWGKLQYLAIVAIPPLWLVFAISYGGHERMLRWPLVAALCVAPVTTLALVATNDLHGLVWANVRLGVSAGVQRLVVAYGPWFWFHTVVSYSLMLAGCLILVRAVWHSLQLYRQHAIILMLGALTPVAGNLVYLLRLGPLGALDLTPFLFTVTGLCLVWGISRTQLLTLVPVAWAQVIQHMRDGVIVLDQRGYVVDMNPAVHELLGERVSLGRPGPALFGATHEVQIELDEGVRALEVHRSSLLDRRSRAAGQLVVVHDVTERKQVERELRQQREAQRDLAERAEAGSRAKSAFIANMSHELRTPLSTILGYSDLVVGELNERGQGDLAADLAHVRGAGMHLLSMVDQVLTLTRAEAGQLRLAIEHFDLADLAERALAAAQPLARAGRNTLVGVWDDDLGTIKSDPARLQQILAHLLSNACKFTSGGQVRLEVRRGDPATGGPQGPEGQVIFRVIDSGIGMTPAQIDHIFERFSQADSASNRRYGGMGIGLTLTRSLCELLGATLTVTSCPGKGTTFEVRLPPEP